MTKNVLITMDSLHKNDQDSGSFQAQVHGTYRQIQGRHIVAYKEILEENFEGEPVITHCLLKIAKDHISLTKRGQADTEMYFKLGESFDGFYHTPIGPLQMHLHTSRLEISETENMISINLEYGLDLNGSHSSDCCLNIKIKSC